MPKPTAKQILKGLDSSIRPAVEDMARETQKHMETAFRARGREVMRKLTTSDLRDRINAASEAYSDIRAKNLTKTLVQTTANMLEPTVKRALDEGWSPGELREALASHYAFSDERLTTIGRTETMEARSGGGKMIAQAVGATRKRCTPEAAGCRLCAENVSAGWIAIDDDFPNGDTPVHPSCMHDMEYS